MITLIFSMDNTSNKRFEKPGIPTIPLPSRVTSDTLSMWLIPLTTSEEGASLPDVIRVPSSSLAKVFFIQAGMFFSTKGCRVGGYITFAPK